MMKVGSRPSLPFAPSPMSTRKDTTKHVLVVAVGLQPLPTQAALQAWLDGLPELEMVASTEAALVGESHGGDVTVGVIRELADTLARRYHDADGFVVLHGVDGVLHTAAALAFCLGGLGKSVACTVGGPPSITVPGLSDVGQRANLINAVQAATLDLPEVSLAFGNRLLRAVAASRASLPDGTLRFAAPPEALLGRIDFSVRLNDSARRLRPRGKFAVGPLADGVQVVPLTPWLSADLLRETAARAGGLLLDARPASQLPRWLLRWLEREPLACPVAVLTAAPAPALARREVAVLASGTREALLAKLAWAAAAARSPREAATLLIRPLVGEFSL